MCKSLFLSSMQKTRALLTFLLLLFLSLSFTQATQSVVSLSKDTVIILDQKGKYIPFTFFTKPQFEMKNNKLNIAVTDRNGDMIQINGIAAASLKNTELSSSGFQTVYITGKGTYTDDGISKNCLLDIRCDNNTTGNPVSVGLKTTVRKNNKTYRIYATLSGTIPAPASLSIQSN